MRFSMIAPILPSSKKDAVADLRLLNRLRQGAARLVGVLGVAVRGAGAQQQHVVHAQAGMLSQRHLSCAALGAA